MSVAQPQVIDLGTARRAKEKREYVALVLSAWDDLDHQDLREFRERRAEVERKARQSL